MNIVTGDYVRFTRPIFKGGSFHRGRYRGGAKCIGKEMIEGTIERESYGAGTGQHTFTIRLADGAAVMVKGRNLYASIIEHRPGADHAAREADKAARIKLAVDSGGALAALPARLRKTGLHDRPD